MKRVKVHWSLTASVMLLDDALERAGIDLRKDYSIDVDEDGNYICTQD